MYPLSNPYQVGQKVKGVHSGIEAEVVEVTEKDVTVRGSYDGTKYFVGQGPWLAMLTQYPIVDTTLPNGQSNVCLHDFKTYRGFREEYDYCTKCDAKRFT